MPKTSIRTRIKKLLATAQGRSYAVAAVTGGLFILMVLVGVLPLLSAVLSQVEANSQQRDILERMKAKQSVLQNLVNEEKAKRPVTLALDAAFPNDLAQVELIQLLTRIEEAAGTKYTLINFGDLEGKKSLRQVFNVVGKLSGKVITISADGGRDQLEQLVTLLEESRRVVNIRTLSVTKRTDDLAGEVVTGNEFRLDLQAEIYLYSEPEE